MKVLIAYDGTLQAKAALRYGLEKVKKNGGELIALHVFNRNLFIHYDAVPRVEEVARRESAQYIKEAEIIIREEGKGVKASIVMEEGNPESEILRYAEAEHIDILLCPTQYRSIVKKFRKILNDRVETNIYVHKSSPYSGIPSDGVTIYAASTLDAQKVIW